MTETTAPGASAPPDSEPAGGGLARSTVVFAVLTGAARVIALVREMAAAHVFGIGGRMSAFTVAFQVPNLFRALLADAALQGAFIPVFTDLLTQGRRRDALRLAWTLALLIVLVLGVLSVAFFFLAPLLVSALAPGFDDDPALRDLTTGLMRVLFPTVMFFALSSVVAGMLNSFDRFSPPVIAQIVWNVVIVGGLLIAAPSLEGDDEIYAYALAIVAATVVQFAFPLPWLARRDGIGLPAIDLRSPDLRRVGQLMVPVTLALGLFNLSLIISTLIGTLVSTETPAAIDRAFRILVLPQAVFVLAVQTTLFPTMARLASRRALDELRHVLALGIRGLSMVMIPAGFLLAVMAEPVTRLIYERGQFDAEATDLVALALAVWCAVLPFQAASNLLSQTFFSLERAWVTAALSIGYVVGSAAVALALYRPLGIAGVILGNVVGNVVLTAGNWTLMRRTLGSLEGAETAGAVGRMLVAGLAMAGIAYPLARGLEALLGRGVAAELVTLAVASAAGITVYAGLVLALRVPEARLARDRLRRLARR